MTETTTKNDGRFSSERQPIKAARAEIATLRQERDEALCMKALLHQRCLDLEQERDLACANLETRTKNFTAAARDLTTCRAEIGTLQGTVNRLEAEHRAQLEIQRGLEREIEQRKNQRRAWWIAAASVFVALVVGLGFGGFFGQGGTGR